MKRMILSIVAAPLILGLAACELPLAGDPAQTCFRHDGFMGQSVTQVSCAGPHDFSAREATGH